jgi:hypothetical protein
MEFIGAKKKTDTTIVDPVIRNEARQYSVQTRLAFLPDDVIGQSWYFRLLTLIYYYIFVYFHGFESKIDEKSDTIQFDFSCSYRYG